MRLLALAVALFGCGDAKKQPPASSPSTTPVAAPVTGAPIVPAPPVKLPVDRLHHHHAIVIDEQSIDDLDLSADGTRIAVAGDDHVVIADRTTRAVVRRIPAETDSVAIAADGMRVAFVGEQLVLHDTATGKLVATRKGEFERVARCGDGYLAAERKHARLLGPDFADRGTLAIEEDLGIHGSVGCHNDRAVLVAKQALFVFGVRDRKLITRIAIEPDGDTNGLVDVAVGAKYIATLSNAGSVWLFDASGKRIAHAPHVAGQAQDLALSADETVLAAGGVLLSLPDLAIRARAPMADARAFTPDGAWLVIAEHLAISVIDVEALPERIDGHLDTAHSMAIDPTGRLLATGAEGRIYLWSLADAKPGAGLGPLVGVIDGHAGGTFGKVSVAFHPDGKRLFSGGNGVIAVWDAATRARIASWVLTDGEHHESELDLEVDAHHVVAAGSNFVYVFDAQTYKPVAKLGSFMLPNGWSGSVWSIALHPDGKHVAVTSHGGLGVFERATGKLVAERPANKEAGESVVTISPDGKQIVELSSTHTKVYAWPRLVETGSFEGRSASDTAWSPDSKRLATGAWSGGSIAVADVSKGLRPTWEHQAPWHIAAIVWDAPRKLMYATGADDGIQVIDADTGKLHAVWTGAAGEGIDTVTFSADTKELVTYQDEIGSVRVWSMSTFEQTAHFDLYLEDHSEPRLVGDRFVAWTNRGELRRWQRDGQNWRELPAWKPPTEYDWFGLGITADAKTAYVVGNETGELAAIDVATLAVTKRKTPLRVGSFEKPRFDAARSLLVVEGMRENTLELWNVAQNKRLHTLATEVDERIDAVHFASDHVIVEGNTRRRWSIATGKATPDCKDEFRFALGFDANGKRAVWKTGGSLLVRQAGTCGNDIALYAEEYDRTSALSGDRLVVTNEGRITVWDLTKREPIAIMRALRDGLWSSRTVARYVAPARVALKPKQ